jgi:hypothetical protein
MFSMTIIDEESSVMLFISHKQAASAKLSYSIKRALKYRERRDSLSSITIKD